MGISMIRMIGEMIASMGVPSKRPGPRMGRGG
jgi:hypothetical protein